jgi:hypothetical protein
VAALEQKLDQQHRLFAELWISFVALIRSYVAAHDLAKPLSDHASVDDRKAGRLTLRGERKTLTLEFDEMTGAGSWTIYEDDLASERVLERGKFRMTEDSQVSLSDRMGKLEMEVAAEAFTSKVLDEE